MPHRLPLLLVTLCCMSPLRLVAQRGDTTSAKAAILAADSALQREVAARGQQAVLDQLLPDAPLLFFSAPLLSAREAAPRFLARYDAPGSYTWRTVQVVASSDGTFGCNVGFSHFVHRDSVGTAPHGGAFIMCWQKQSDGQWRLVAHQRRDTMSRTTAWADTSVLREAPRSATMRGGRDDARIAQDVDLAFATMAALPAGPGPAFVAYAADDGRLLTPVTLPRGRAAIAETFADFETTRVIDWTPSRRFGVAAGGLAFTVGESVNHLRDGRPDGQLKGKFMTVWRKDPDGRWRYLFDLGSPRFE